jgi:iron complex outermembrane receptor protein
MSADSTLLLRCAGRLFAALMVALPFACAAFAQNQLPASTTTGIQPTGVQTTRQNPPSPQKPAPVTTTVIVHGDINGDYLPESITVGNLTGLPINNAPLSSTAVTRDLLNDQAARLLSDVVQNDASVEDDYVPVGYYGDYQIRGFPIDLATGLNINGLTIAGEQDVPLENKERVEFLHGLAGVTSGIASGGGLINFVTKRPAPIKAVDFATDQYGSALGAADFGRFFGRRQQVGARLNLAGENIQTYMNGTAGWRAMGAGAADFKLSPNAILKADFEYQHKTERDGSGYQLLGGTTLPDINQLYRSTMLGEQSWAPPDTYDVFNTNARLDYHLPHDWSAFAAASLSHSLIQDNVIYAYGSSMAYDPSTGLYDIPDCPGVTNAPAYFFCPAVPGVKDSGGDYGIYDYRDPGELRIDAVAEGIIAGRIKTGAATHNIVIGSELFLRSVQQPGFYTVADPYDPSGIVQDGAVYTYLGAENIYQPLVAYPIESPVEAAGPRRLWEDSHQSSAVLEDRIELPHRIQLIAGGRYDALRDHNYSLVATTPCIPSPNNTPGPPNDPCPTTYDSFGNPIYSIPNSPTLSDKPVWLPQFAATYSPATNFTLYANYGVLLSLGPQAPWWVDNASQFLAPYNTRQVEIGAKFQADNRILITGDYFHMRAPFFYPESDGAGGFIFISQGRETHNGVELNAEGRAARWLRVDASIAGISAVSQNTGTPSYNNQQVINVPRVHSNVFADVTVPHVSGLYFMPGWNFSSLKYATRDDQVSVPGVNLFNLGLRYTPGGERGRTTFRIYASNIANKKYWSDTGASYGDTFVWLGAPALVRFSAHYSF